MDDVFATLKEAGSGELRDEAEQLEAMYKVLSGYYMDRWRTRRPR